MKSTSKMNLFSWAAQRISYWSGSASAFACALLLVLGWAITGPLFDYSATWQLVINTTTTIITFLMVFLIQHTQNRDTIALQVKLDELIRVTKGAHTSLVNLEELSDEELDVLHKRYERLAEEARDRLQVGEQDTDAPEIEIDYGKPG